MSAIKELEAEVNRLRAELHEAVVKLDEAKIAASGVSIGDIVVGTGRDKGKTFRVCEIDATWSRPWLTGNPMRADGTFGTAKRHLYDNWEPQR